MTQGFTPGLQDTVAAETALSHVDGAAGRLILRGRDLDALAGQPFEAMLALLWEGTAPQKTPQPMEAEALRSALGAARQEAFALMQPLLPAARALPPVPALRLMLSALPDTQDAAIRSVAATGTFTAAIARLAMGETPVAPDPARGHAEDMLAMLTGAAPEPAQVAALDRYLVTVADHGLNASTFAARVVASTRAGTVSSVVAALCALKGPLHGGAPGPVLDMLDGIGEAGNARPWLAAALDRGERLMGFGHRIYRVRDPRADVLKAGVQTLRGSGRIALAETVEAEALALLAERKPDRPLQTNVEFYTALLLEALGWPRDSFTCVFAAGRVAGWTAHVREEERTGRLIRPQSRYVGPAPAR
ncbi:citrate synthase [Pseudoroseicyclus aestuarii]|uniref:Citrate synthase n=1 Tax=Pseudoroseicyclus aestuarii TaxID=1795041 RepID=A0A318SSY3_9RHOB|nr:citrate synthase [Pseudoroseicyclus aestuarii]PYE82412.1 citrate synthase [Pseudoroseicyclus aestuarii]